MPVWFMMPGTKAVALWHSEQAWVVGRWFAGLVVAPPLTAVKLLVDVWQVEQSAVVTGWPAGLLIGVTPA